MVTSINRLYNGDMVSPRNRAIEREMMTHQGFTKYNYMHHITAGHSN